MKKLLFLLVLLRLLIPDMEAKAWVAVPDAGDTGWRTYVYQTGAAGFSGTAGFVVSNVIDDLAYSELLLDNLSQGGAITNLGFELGDLSGYTILGTSYAKVTGWAMAYSGKVYHPVRGNYFCDQSCLDTGVSTAAFQNAHHQAGTTGSILETAVSLPPWSNFTFGWAFLGGDLSPWNDFALFYLQDNQGRIVFSDVLAQIGPGSMRLPPIIGILGSGLLSLLGLERRARQLPADRQFLGGPGPGWARRPGGQPRG